MITWEELRNELFTEEEIQASKERIKKELRTMKYEEYEDWLKAEMEEREKNDAKWAKIHEAEKEAHFNYAIKEKIVKAGNSEIFNKWHEYGVSEEDFLNGLKWLCEDPLIGRGRLTRELGCTPDGKLVKLKRVLIKGQLTAFYEEETGYHWDYNVSISARDRV